MISVSPVKCGHDARREADETEKKERVNMRIMQGSLGWACIGIAAAISAQAANVSGSAQASYNRNLTINHDSTNVNIGHGYDARSGTFTLNNAHLAIAGSDSATGFGYAVELDAGSDAAANFSLSTGIAASTLP